MNAEEKSGKCLHFLFTSLPLAFIIFLAIVLNVDSKLANSENVNYWGAPFAANSLYNIRIGWMGGTVSYRVRAKKNGKVTGFRWYNIFNYEKDGYHAGDGGDLKIEIRTDDQTTNHYPSEIVLSEVLITGPLQLPKFPKIEFNSPIQLEKGKLYHLVISNPDPNHHENYVSVNCLYVPNLDCPRPTSELHDSEVLYTDDEMESEDWSHFNEFTPIYELYYSNGDAQGIGYMEVWIYNKQKLGITNKVRQTFTPRRIYHANSVTVRLRRKGYPGDLRLRLEMFDGTLIEEGNIPQSQITIDSTPDWATYNFFKTRTLYPEQRYNLKLSSPTGNSENYYEIIPIRDGSGYKIYPEKSDEGYGFSEDSVFEEGFAQYTENGSWVGWEYWGEPNRHEADLQFYFTGTFNSGCLPWLYLLL